MDFPAVLVINGTSQTGAQCCLSLAESGFTAIAVSSDELAGFSLVEQDPRIRYLNKALTSEIDFQQLLTTLPSYLYPIEHVIYVPNHNSSNVQDITLLSQHLFAHPVALLSSLPDSIQSCTILIEHAQKPVSIHNALLDALCLYSQQFGQQAQVCRINTLEYGKECFDIMDVTRLMTNIVSGSDTMRAKRFRI